MRVAYRAFIVWCGILVLAVANGGLREAVLIPKLGHGPGLVVSGLLLSVLIVLVAWLSLPWIGARGDPQHVAIGCAWLLITLAFEFSVGLLRGMPMDEILRAYTFEDGNIWPIVLLVVATSPWLVARLRRWR